MLAILFGVDENARPLGGEEREAHRETLHRLVEEALQYSYLNIITVAVLPPGYSMRVEPEEKDS